MTGQAFSSLPGPLVARGAGMFDVLRNFGSSLFLSLSMLVSVPAMAEPCARLTAATTSPESASAHPSLAANLASIQARTPATLSAEIQRKPGHFVRTRISGSPGTSQKPRNPEAEVSRTVII
jgi:hypothetical protein